MTTPAWHQLSTLRDDVRTGKLTLAEFAADLNDARTGSAPVVYRDPGMFFDRTYATHRMKNLARDVLLRLAGQGGKPVLRLQVAYGGGKTHTLITLMHLAERGETLADHRTVKEFATFAGLGKLPQARVALLPGDKIDVIEGLEVYGPHGQKRRVKTLWGALAYQLAGDVGYTRLKSHDENFTIPAEPVLVDLLREPQKEGLGTLILVDEAVLYYRSLVNTNPRMLGTIKDFYQMLTQAAAKVDRAVLVASLMASKIEANDPTGVQCLAALEEVFERIAEPLEPVTRDDVAEILRRRLFERVPGPEERRPVVDALMASLNRLPLQESQRDQVAYDRLLDSYPFHPDLISVLYQKWTQLNKFQRTRGALRLLAYALRESEGKDGAPFVGLSALLPYNTTAKRGLSPALDELTDVCEESYRWTSSLNGELEKAREIQSTLPTMQSREMEMAVVGTFLHSQPSGARASHAELIGMLAHPEIDASAISEGLRKWRERSWFLVENPEVWQIGIVPNLTHMHFHVKNNLKDSEIDDELRKRIRGVEALRRVDAGVAVSMLPLSPDHVDDNLELQYLILEPACAVTLSRPLPAEVEAFFNQKKGPRIYRNNVLALTPEAASVAGLREQVRNWLGWKSLEEPENFKLLSDAQKKMVPSEKQKSTNTLPESVVGAYRVLVAVDEDGKVKAQALTSGGAPFDRIKTLLEEEERLVTTTLDPDLILPGSYFELWGSDKTALRVQDLVASFGQFPRLPRLLRPASLYDTIKRGLTDGRLVLRLPRADGSARTWWLTLPDEETLRRPEIEIQPTALARLHNLDAEMLKPGRIPGLWPESANALSMAQLRSFFDGKQAPSLAEPDLVDAAVEQAVKRGLLMATDGEISFYREDLPAAALAETLRLVPPPEKIGAAMLTAQALPGAWQQNRATLQAIISALVAQRPHPLPWSLIQEAVNDALGMGLLEIEAGSWPCSPAAVDALVLRPVEKIEVTAQMLVNALEYTGSQTPTLAAVKEAIEQQFFNGRSVSEAQFYKVARGLLQSGTLSSVEAWNEQNRGAVRVRRPDTVLFGETNLDAERIQRLAEAVDELFMTAPELNFTFRLTLSAEGQIQDDGLIARLNEILEQIQSGWRLQ